jgi:hypothetical protein
MRLIASAAVTDADRPVINHLGQRRRPGQARRREKKKATRMKPPNILVAIAAPPGSTVAPTTGSLGRPRAANIP